jgi:ribosome-interacting GTPase 1
MAANLTPQYREAEARYRAAHTPEEVLAALEEMWRELPKHKSTEKIQADLKKKLSAARKALQQAPRKGAGRVDPYAIPKCGAGQVALIGTPNVGKSSIIAALTHAHVKIADYPFSTELPVPGMVSYEDVQIQLIDTPPVTAEYVPPGAAGLWRAADALVLVADLSSDSCLEDLDVCLSHLAARSIELIDGPRQRPREAGEPLRVPSLILANKMDAPGADVSLELLRERVGETGGTAAVHANAASGLPRAQVAGSVPLEAVSAREPGGLARLPRLLFELIRVIRIYAKPPGRKPDLEEPFILPVGSDVHELARRVYRGLELRVRAARVWGHGVAAGQNVQLDHMLHDRDIVELHT